MKLIALLLFSFLASLYNIKVFAKITLESTTLTSFYFKHQLNNCQSYEESSNNEKVKGKYYKCYYKELNLEQFTQNPKTDVDFLVNSLNFKTFTLPSGNTYTVQASFFSIYALIAFPLIYVPKNEADELMNQRFPDFINSNIEVVGKIVRPDQNMKLDQFNIIFKSYKHKISFPITLKKCTLTAESDNSTSLTCHSNGGNSRIFSRFELPLENDFYDVIKKENNKQNHFSLKAKQPIFEIFPNKNRSQFTFKVSKSYTLTQTSESELIEMLMRKLDGKPNLTVYFQFEYNRPLSEQELSKIKTQRDFYTLIDEFTDSKVEIDTPLSYTEN